MGDFILKTYNPADETLFFSPRCIGNDLYESVTLLTLENHELGESPRITSFVKDSILYLTINANLWIISDIEAGTVDFAHKFTHTIDTFALIDNLLLLGLNNGEVHLVNTQLKEIVQSCSITENVWFASKFIIGIYQECPENQIFLVLTRKGQLYRVIFDDNNQTLKSELIIDFAHSISIAAYSNGFLLLFGSKMIVYDMFLQIPEELNISNTELKDLWPYNQNCFIGLNTNGTFCQISLLPMSIETVESDEKIEQFLFYVHQRQNYMCYVTGNGVIKMFESSREKVPVFNINAENIAQLVYTSSENDNQMYLTKDPMGIALHQIQEAKPEDRLQRLVRKMLFSEAEAFAKAYNLSPIIIDKTKVASYLEKDSCLDEEVDQFLQLLHKIPDVQFRVKSLLAAINICESVQGIEKILKFASKNTQRIDNRELELLLNGIVCSYDMYKTLCGCNGIEMTVTDFEYFHRCDLYDYLCDALRDDKLESAIIVFPRLTPEYFTLENITKILQYLNKYGLNQFTAFLSTMVPVTLWHYHEAISIFVEAIVQKIHLIERNQREVEFPEKTIEFVEKMLKIFSGDRVMSAKMSTKEEDVKAIHMIEKLFNISKCLHTILELKNNFGIFLPLQDCLDGPGAMLRSLMRLNIKCTEIFLKSFLIKFMISNNFDADEILGAEIGELLKCHKDYWVSHVPQVWRCIISTGKRLELLLDILHAAPLPWCADIRKMLTDALEWNHPLVSTLQMEANNEAKYIVLSRREYLLRESLESIEKDTYIIQRIIYCNLPSLIEDIYTLCTSKISKTRANFLLLKHFIEANDLKTVFTLVNQHSVEERRIYLRQLHNIYSKNFILCDTNLRKTIIVALGFIKQKSIDSVHESNFDIDIFKIINVLPSDLLHIDLFDRLQTKAGRQDVEKLVIAELGNLTDDFEQFLAQCKILSEALNVPCDALMFDVCQGVKDVNFIYKCALYLYDNSDNVRILTLMTVLILNNIGMDGDDVYGTFFNDTVLNDAGKPVDEKLFVYCLDLSRLISAKAYLLSERGQKESNVVVWAQNTFRLQPGNEISDKTCKQGVKAYFPLGGSSSIYSINFLNTLFTMFCDFCKKSQSLQAMDYFMHKFPKDIENSQFDDADDEQMTKESFCKLVITRLQSALPSIMRENQHWTVLNALLSLKLQLDLFADTDQKANESLACAISKLRGKHLALVFAAQQIDFNLSFSSLLAYPRASAQKTIKDAAHLYKLNLVKFEDICKLGSTLAAFYDSKDHYKQTMLGIKWKKELTKCTLPMKTFFLSLNNKELLDPLISQNEISLQQLTSFCADFELDNQKYYLQYLNHTLSTWKPTFEVKVDALGNRKHLLHSDEEELIKKCLEVVALIKNRDAVLKCVDTLWKTVNFYYYEVFVAMLRIASFLNEAGHPDLRSVLHFLKTYQRTSKPGPVEIEEWSSRFLYQQLDNISEWRFPLSQMLFTPDLWKILRTEIKLTNYEDWFLLVGALKHLDRNELCSIVVKEVEFVSEQSGGGDADNYNLQAKFKDVFTAIDKCLSYITDPELAASMAFHLIPKPSEGADRVLASELAYKYARICKTVGMNSAMYLQIEKGYYTYLSKHILQVHNLARNDYLSLVDSPDDLINALYQDERILMPLNSCLSQCPDINKAADELGLLFNIDMRKKHMELLSLWLIDQNILLGGDGNQTVCLLPDVNYSSDQNSECVLRAAYLCLSDDVEFWREYLRSLFDRSEDFQMQGRLLKTLCMITSPEELVKNYECTYDELLLSIDRLYLLPELKSMGIALDLDQLASIDKNRLLYKLGKKLSDPLGIKVMMAVCDIDNTFDIAVWEKIVQGMIRFKMVDELKKTIVRFSKENTMFYNPSYQQAWQVVVDHTSETLETTDEDFDSALVNFVHFVQCSPVLNDLDLAEGVRMCIHRKKYAFALLLLQYVPGVKREEILQELLCLDTKKNLLASLEGLNDMGFIGMKRVSALIQHSS